jgi:hypothetical protein
LLAEILKGRDRKERTRRIVSVSRVSSMVKVGLDGYPAGKMCSSVYSHSLEEGWGRTRLIPLFELMRTSGRMWEVVGMSWVTEGGLILLLVLLLTLAALPIRVEAQKVDPTLNFPSPRLFFSSTQLCSDRTSSGDCRVLQATTVVTLERPHTLHHFYFPFLPSSSNNAFSRPVRPPSQSCTVEMV